MVNAVLINDHLITITTEIIKEYNNVSITQTGNCPKEPMDIVDLNFPVTKRRESKKKSSSSS